jgi:hypothetical protein
MPDSAVNPASPDGPATLADDPAVSSPAPIDSDTKPARVMRPGQRSFMNGRAPYGAPTLDLFAEDTERATLQALNTDIRQCMLPGFELPEVFMAAVEAVSGMAGGEEHLALLRAARREVPQDDAPGCALRDAPANGELPLTPADHSHVDEHTCSRKGSPQSD